MNCKKTIKRLPLYISDDLGQQEMTEMESHLSECLNCYREYQANLKSYRALKRLSEKPDLNPVLGDFTNQVMDRIAQDIGGPAASIPKVSYHFVPKSIAAAALVLLAIAGFYLILGGDSTDPVQPSNPIRHGTSIEHNPGFVNPRNGPALINRMRTGKLSGAEIGTGDEDADEKEIDLVRPRFPSIQPAGKTEDL